MIPVSKIKDRLWSFIIFCCKRMNLMSLWLVENVYLKKNRLIIPALISTQARSAVWFACHFDRARKDNIQWCAVERSENLTHKNIRGRRAKKHIWSETLLLFLWKPVGKSPEVRNLLWRHSYATQNGCRHELLS